MLKIPSARKKKRAAAQLNLVPILDANFILIFFLLMSSNFIKIMEIASDVPIISTKAPPPQEKTIPLALTVKILSDGFAIYTGVPSALLNKIPTHDLEALHSQLVALKLKHPQEKMVVLEPEMDLPYEKIVDVMDSVRNLRNTDESIYAKNDKGVEVKVTELFGQVIFGNVFGG
ncbi:MAG: biopolymer transporter ExbD [Oligoflexia bacterium]|nr:biopolymer transporter ExbD [Oligoflexia bacterium]